MSEPIAEYKRTGFHLILYPNRLEAVAGFGLTTKTVIPLRNVANVEKPVSLQGDIIVKTNDGKKHRFACMGDAKRMYEAILNAL